MQFPTVAFALAGLAAAANVGFAASLSASHGGAKVTCTEAFSGYLKYAPKPGGNFVNVGVKAPFLYTEEDSGQPPSIQIEAKLMKCDSKYTGYNKGKAIGHLTLSGQCASVNLETGSVTIGKCSDADDASQLPQTWQVAPDGSLTFLGTKADEPLAPWKFQTQGGTRSRTITASKDDAATIVLAIQ